VIPEEARKILDPVLERMMDAVHRYEGTVNQVMGNRIMALFGAPIAHEDHACQAALTDAGDGEAIRERSAPGYPSRVDESAVRPFAGRLRRIARPMKLVCAHDDVAAPKKEK